LVQVNVARAKAPLDSAALAGFIALLEPVNARADAAPGFVWRLQDDAGDATSIRISEDAQLIVNLSVWESLEDLWQFVYDSGHIDVMRRRREWMERLAEAHLALFWIPAGSIPSVDEALARLDHLRAHGPTQHAFTFKHHFPPPGTAAREIIDDSLSCPA
jgi:hypothetical protein